MIRSKAIRKFERLLFKGVPEQPEHNYERDQNSNVSLRLTGRSQSISTEIAADEDNVIGFISYDFANQKEIFQENKNFKNKYITESV